MPTEAQELPTETQAGTSWPQMGPKMTPNSFNNNNDDDNNDDDNDNLETRGSVHEKS